MEQSTEVNSLQTSLGGLATQDRALIGAFVRIVRLSFRSACVEQFVELFEENKLRIAGHAGCRFVYLLRCGDTFFTLSGWDRPEDLETYRTSEMFRSAWEQTRSWLAEPAQVWSCPISSWAARPDYLHT